MCGQEMSFSLIYLQYTLVRKQEWWCCVVFTWESRTEKAEWKDVFKACQRCHWEFFGVNIFAYRSHVPLSWYLDFVEPQFLVEWLILLMSLNNFLCAVLVDLFVCFGWRTQIFKLFLRHLSRFLFFHDVHCIWIGSILLFLNFVVWYFVFFIAKVIVSGWEDATFIYGYFVIIWKNEC